MVHKFSLIFKNLFYHTVTIRIPVLEICKFETVSQTNLPSPLPTVIREKLIHKYSLFTDSPDSSILLLLILVLKPGVYSFI